MFMRASRQDEIFEDCLSALLEGRRTVAESLALYPGLANHLGPLLETAAGVSQDLRHQPLPKAEVKEQIRQRLMVGKRTPQRNSATSVPWLDGRCAFLGSALVVVVASLLLIVVSLLVTSR